jgi:hypothetical protein
MKLLGNLKDEMFRKIGRLIPVKSNLLQRVRKFRKNRLLLGLIFPELEEHHKHEH